MKTNACLAHDRRTVICDFGQIDIRSGETAEDAGRRAYVRWPQYPEVRGAR